MRTAPNLRDVKACNNCAHSLCVGGISQHSGGCVVECSIYDDVYSIYNELVCDDHKDMEEE